MPVNLELETATRDVLDFSKLVITCQEDLDDALQKIPDYRTRPEKIRPDDLHRDSTNFTFSITKNELQPELFGFLSPIPVPLNAVKLDDIRSMDINWLMLTELRPETKQDEELFNRIVQLERVTYKTVIQEQSQLLKAQHKATKSKKVKSKISGKVSGIEDRGDVCPECDDEHCGGICKEFLYEAHERLPPADDDDANVPQPLSEGKDGEKKKKKIKKKVKKKSETGKEEAAKESKVIKKRKTISKAGKLESGKGKEKSQKGAKSISDSSTVQQQNDDGDTKVKELTKSKVKSKLPTTSKRTTKKSSTTRSENTKKSTKSDRTDSKERKNKLDTYS